MLKVLSRVDWRHVFCKLDVIAAAVYLFIFSIVRFVLGGDYPVAWVIWLFDFLVVSCAIYLVAAITARTTRFTGDYLHRFRLEAYTALIFFRGTERAFEINWPKDRIEVVYGSAIRHPSGVIYAVLSPGKHEHCAAAMAVYRQAAPENLKDQGYITSHGRFLDSREALVIATMRNQLRIKIYDPKVLYPEDMWS